MELGNMIFGNSRGEYHIERFPAQDYFAEFLDQVGLDYHGHPNPNSPLLKYVDSKGLIDTEMFSLFPYYWGDDEDLAELPNFTYKPDNIVIQWYKYPLRDSYSNVELDADRIKDMLEKCQAFVSSLKNTNSKCFNT